MSRFESLDEVYDHHVRRTESGCWGWDGPRTTSGYPLVCFNGLQVAGQRVGWAIAHGALPPEIYLINPSRCRCPNPAHYVLNPTRRTRPTPKEL